MATSRLDSNIIEGDKKNDSVTNTRNPSASAPSPKPLTFHNMSHDDYKTAREWAVKLSWNPPCDEFQALQALDSKALWMAKDEEGNPIGSIYAVKYSRKKLAFIGQFIVDQKLQGKGYGRFIFNHTINSLSGYNIALFAVKDRVTTYLKWGFNALQYNNQDVVVTRIKVTINTDTAAVKESRPESKEDNDSTQYKEISSEDFSSDKELGSYYEAHCFPSSTAYLQQRLKNKDSFGIVAIKNGKCVGFGIIIPTQSGRKISPLVADGMGTAQPLLEKLHSKFKDEPTVLDIPSCNPDADKFIKIYSKAGNPTAFNVMIKAEKTSPTDINYQHVFSVGSLEIG